MDLGAALPAEPGTVVAELCSSDGWPIPEASLTVIDSAGAQVARVGSDEQGAVAATGLQAGTYTAIITAVGYEPVARTAVVRDGAGAAVGVVALDRVGGADLPDPGLWKIDPVHSSLRVSTRHLGISAIRGRFNEFGGEVRIGNPITSSVVEARIVSASVDTANTKRDEHLRSLDFLDVERYPEIAFTSTGLRRTGGDDWELYGELTLCGITRPVVLNTRFSGVGPDPWGGVRASATASTRLRREDFAITFNQSLQTGIAAIGATLKVEMDIQLVKQD
ncbi:YceI family protein [Parasphingorhabdus pacifica]